MTLAKVISNLERTIVGKRALLNILGDSPAEIPIKQIVSINIAELERILADAKAARDDLEKDLKKWKISLRNSAFKL